MSLTLNASRLLGVFSVLGVAGLVTVLFAGDRSEVAGAQDSTVSTLTESAVVRQDLAQFTTLEASLQLDDSLTLTSARQGTLVALDEPGTVIERGEVLYLVSDQPTEQELETAASQVEAGESQLANSSSQLADLSEGASAGDLAAAQASVTSAERALADLTEPASAADLAAAQAAIDSAESLLGDLLAGAGDAETASAEALVAQAEAGVVSAEGSVAMAWTSLVSAHTDYCALAGPPVDLCAAQAPLSLADLDALDAAIEGLIVGGDPDGVLTATQTLADAQRSHSAALATQASTTESFDAARSSLDRLSEPPAAASVATAEAAVSTAQQNYDTLAAGPDSLRLAEAQANLASADARQHDAQAGASAEALAAAAESLESAEAALQVSVGQLETLTDSDTAPILMYGYAPATRALDDGAVGDDVAQLQANLIALGYDVEGALAVTGTYDFVTVAAVSMWQEDRGVTATGAVDVDDVVFLPGPVQIDAWAVGVQRGGSVMSGAALAEVTPIAALNIQTEPDPDADLRTTQRVIAEIPLDDRSLIAVGDRVTVQLPDLSEVEAAVTAISSIPIEDTLTGDTWVEATIAPDESIADLWIGADVEVLIVSELAADVLTVPVSALVALVEGGYAVEVPEGESSGLVGVTTGMFADGQVEIDGNIEAGATVLIPR